MGALDVMFFLLSVNVFNWSIEVAVSMRHLSISPGVKHFVVQATHTWRSGQMVCFNKAPNKKWFWLSATGNRTPVSRVTGGDTSHYTIAEKTS